MHEKATKDFKFLLDSLKTAFYSAGGKDEMEGMGITGGGGGGGEGEGAEEVRVNLTFFV